MLGFGHGVQNGLGDAIADGGVDALAGLGVLHIVDLAGQLLKAGQLPADQMGGHHFMDVGDKVLGQEQGVPSAGAGILDGGAIAQGDLAVGQHQLDADGFAGHADGGEARRHGVADIGGAVVFGAGLDGLLVVEIKACAAFGADNLFNFHGNLILPKS